MPRFRTPQVVPGGQSPVAGILRALLSSAERGEERERQERAFELEQATQQLALDRSRAEFDEFSRYQPFRQRAAARAAGLEYYAPTYAELTPEPEPFQPTLRADLRDPGLGPRRQPLGDVSRLAPSLPPARATGALVNERTAGLASLAPGRRYGYVPESYGPFPEEGEDLDTELKRALLRQRNAAALRSLTGGAGRADPFIDDFRAAIQEEIDALTLQLDFAPDAETEADLLEQIGQLSDDLLAVTLEQPGYEGFDRTAAARQLLRERPDLSDEEAAAELRRREQANRRARRRRPPREPD